MDKTNTIKVSDFGLSLDIYEKNYFRQEKGNSTKLPIKWMALESIMDGIFSEKTDIVRNTFTCICTLWKFTLALYMYRSMNMLLYMYV